MSFFLYYFSPNYKDILWNLKQSDNIHCHARCTALNIHCYHFCLIHQFVLSFICLFLPFFIWCFFIMFLSLCCSFQSFPPPRWVQITFCFAFPYFSSPKGTLIITSTPWCVDVWYAVRCVYVLCCVVIVLHVVYWDVLCVVSLCWWCFAQVFIQSLISLSLFISRSLFLWWRRITRKWLVVSALCLCIFISFICFVMYILLSLSCV